MNFLKNHPFAVEAYFKTSTVLTFAVPKEKLQPLIPKKLTLDTFQNHWGFIAVAFVEAKHLRPKGFPKLMGNDFFLIGYRIFTKYKNKAGKNLRGLYILKSETNSKKMTFLGNIFTHYHYHTIDIKQVSQGNKKITTSEKSTFEFIISHQKKDCQLPKHSPFENWNDARKFSGPLPHTFTYQKKTDEMLIVQGIRQNWKPKPIYVESAYFDYLKILNLGDIKLASAFEITNIPYHWKKGIIEKWK